MTAVDLTLKIVGAYSRKKADIKENFKAALVNRDFKDANRYGFEKTYAPVPSISVIEDAFEIINEFCWDNGGRGK